MRGRSGWSGRRRGGRLAALALLGAFAGPGTPSLAQDATETLTPIRIVYLSREGDPAYAELPSEDGVFRAALPEPFPGAELAVRDMRSTAHAVGAKVVLDRDIVPTDGDAVAEARKAVDSSAAAIIADLPLADLQAVAKAVPAQRLPVFNIRHADNALRTDLCATGVFHVAASTSMLTDSLAQFVVKKNWRQVLLMIGPLPADKAFAESFALSAKKFGAKIVDTKDFIFGNDPRQRDQTNVALMTASANYDVLALADTTRDFGRFVPYEQARPRPVIGTEGLQATAWNALAERFGAPQVNHRFERNAHRSMTEGDWAAWVAVRSVVEAVTRAKATTGPAIEAALAKGDLAIDVSKGVESSYRPWDRQFRQSIMLASGDAVVAYAPFDGFLHPGTTLDTLGTDEAEMSCKPPAP